MLETGAGLGRPAWEGLIRASGVGFKGKMTALALTARGNGREPHRPTPGFERIMKVRSNHLLTRAGAGGILGSHGTQRSMSGAARSAGRGVLTLFLQRRWVMAVRVAINGFGRIGRLVLRAIYESGRTDLEVVAINDLADAKTNAHLLKYDSVHGRFDHSVEAADGAIIVDGKKITVSAIKNPEELPWKAKEAQIVFECSGVFTKRSGAGCAGTHVHPRKADALARSSDSCRCLSA